MYSKTFDPWCECYVVKILCIRRSRSVTIIVLLCGLFRGCISWQGWRRLFTGCEVEEGRETFPLYVKFGLPDRNLEARMVDYFRFLGQSFVSLKYIYEASLAIYQHTPLPLLGLTATFTLFTAAGEENGWPLHVKYSTLGSRVHG